jgi:hypothetical protein
MPIYLYSEKLPAIKMPQIKAVTPFIHLSKRHYLSLFFIALFGTYYHIIFHSCFIHFDHLDDMNLLTRLLNEPSFVLKDLFFVATGWYLTSVAFRISQLYKTQHWNNRVVPFLKEL